MLKGVTKSGFRFSINENVMNDWEMMEKLAEMEDNPLASVAVIKKMLGKNQYEALKSHLKKKNGRITTEAMMECFTNFMNAKPETKK